MYTAAQCTLSMQQRALGASVAALGLSNKAVYEDDISNGSSAEPTGSMTNYTEVSCLFQETVSISRQGDFGLQ